MRNKDFCAFILTHGRAGRVDTFKTLRKQGYTGDILLVVDDEDKDYLRYCEEFGARNVCLFSKSEIVKRFDEGDNFGDRRAIVYARNATFDIAKERGYTYFIELDDDYTSFTFRLDGERKVKENKIKNLDAVLDLMLDYYKSCPQMLTIAMAQGGDWIGGGRGAFGKDIHLHRKAMNSFICSTERRFWFVGRVNEDVNTYTLEGIRGKLFATIPQICLHQRTTQGNKGGMTEMYLDSGTYVKSFYSVMYAPSSVKVQLMTTSHARLHHKVDWSLTAPKIVSEKTAVGEL